MGKLFKLFIFIALGFLVYHRFTRVVFENIEPGGEPNLFKIIEWKLTRDKPVWPKLPENKSNITFMKPRVNRTKDLNITYINHASFLIQTANRNIITDPIWSDYAGPFGKYGVKRSVHPGIELKDLPPIDIILISHSHYDHLDLASIEAITKKDQPIIITGLGVTRYIDYCNAHLHKCFELNWWDKAVIEKSVLKIRFVPAHHWTSRNWFDRNTSLWGGFIISNNNQKIYFAGDTGYGQGKIFEQIYQRYGKIDISLLPIGAYKPEWFFTNMHTSPKQAVKIFKTLKSDYAIPMHYDIFELTDEKFGDPLDDLNKALSEENVPKEKFLILKPGYDLLSNKSYNK